MNTNKIIKSLTIIACIIILCTVIVKLTVPNETLLDYANENPELAYATPEKEETEVTVSGNYENSTSENNVIAADEFYYTELTDEIKTRITGISYPITKNEASSLNRTPINVVEDSSDIQITYDNLRYLHLLYYDFHGEVQEGEIICNSYIAEDLKEIFYELYCNSYPIESVRLIDDYNGDDEASMEANNCSCFNYRVIDGTTRLSNHALGCAIDINPFYNPYIVFNRNEDGQDYITPKGSEIYADRSNDFEHKIDENDLCYQLFKEHGFSWGGNWESSKDYQHFEKLNE